MSTGCGGKRQNAEAVLEGAASESAPRTPSHSPAGRRRRRLRRRRDAHSARDAEGKATERVKLPAGTEHIGYSDTQKAAYFAYLVTFLNPQLQLNFLMINIIGYNATFFTYNVFNM